MVTSPSVLCVVVSRLSFPLVRHSISCCQYFAPHCFHLPLISSRFAVFSHLCLPHPWWLCTLGRLITPLGNRHVGPLRHFCLAAFCSAAFHTPIFCFGTFRFAPVRFTAFRFPTFCFGALAVWYIPLPTYLLAAPRFAAFHFAAFCFAGSHLRHLRHLPLLHLLRAAALHSLRYIALHNHRSATFLLPPSATLSFRLFATSPLPIQMALVALLLLCLPTSSSAVCKVFLVYHLVKLVAWVQITCITTLTHPRNDLLVV